MTDRDPPRKTAADFDPEVLHLFDKYVHGAIDRRAFLDGASRFAVGGVTAAALLEALSPNFAAAEQVPKTDPRVKAETVAAVRSSAEERRREVRGLPLSRHAARLQQRHDAAFRRRGGQAGLGPHRRLLNRQLRT